MKNTKFWVLGFFSCFFQSFPDCVRAQSRFPWGSVKAPAHGGEHLGYKNPYSKSLISLTFTWTHFVWCPGGAVPAALGAPVKFISVPRDSLGTWKFPGHGKRVQEVWEVINAIPEMFLRQERRLRAAFTPCSQCSQWLQLHGSLLECSQLGISSCGHRELAQGSSKHPQALQFLFI